MVKNSIKSVAGRIPLLRLLVERISIYTKITCAPAMRFRSAVATVYLSGQGIEIGPLHRPTKLPRTVSVRYVDLMSAGQAKQTFPELKDYHLCHVDLIDDGQFLERIPNNSLDFIIANHMLEHTPNPLKTLEIWLGKLADGGVLFFALPNKEVSFDRERPITSLEHLLRDYTEGPDWNKEQHFAEYGRFVDHIPENELPAKVQQWIAENRSIHYHVWTPEAFWEVLLHCKKVMQWPFQIELMARNQDEFLSVIRKQI